MMYTSTQVAIAPTYAGNVLGYAEVDIFMVKLFIRDSYDAFFTYLRVNLIKLKKKAVAI